MPDIKRLNYFNGQFLTETDFNDAQTYLISIRRRLNSVMHGWGIAAGLDVSKSGSDEKTVSVSPGIAFDKMGQEIALMDEKLLVLSGSNNDIYLTIAYSDFSDPADQVVIGNETKLKRITEHPIIAVTASLPPADGSVIKLAKITLDANGTIKSIDTSVRQQVSSFIAPGAITTNKLSNGAVTLDKLDTSVQPIVSIEGVKMPGGNIDLAPANAITITPDNATSRITIGETHSVRPDNPHATTAGQIDAQGGPNRIVSQINAGTGIVAEARLDAAIARTTMVNDKFNSATGHDHDGTDSKKISPTNLDGVSTTVTAANLNTLTNGGTASSLHKHTATDVGALPVTSYDFKNRMDVSLVFSQSDADKAQRTINVQFLPKFVWATGFCNALMEDNLNYGVTGYGFADLHQPTIQHCSGVHIIRSSAHWIQDAGANNEIFCAAFTDQTVSPMREDSLGVSIGSVTNSAITFTLRRVRCTTATYNPIRTFNMTIKLLLLG